MRLSLALILSAFVLAQAPARAQAWREAKIPESVSGKLDASAGAMISDPETAFAAARDGERIALSVAAPETRLISLAYVRWIGAEALLRTDRVRAAERLIGNAEILARRTRISKLTGDVLQTRGGVSAALSRSAEALAAYQSAYRAFQAAGYNRGMAIALQNIAALYVNGGDYKNADRYFRQSDEIYRDDPKLSLTLYNNRAAALMTAKQYDESIEQYGRALKIARSERSRYFEARILTNIANAQLEKGDGESASRTVARAIGLVRQPEAQDWYRPVAAVAAQAAFQRGDRARAEYWIGQAFEGLDLETTTASFRDAHSTAFELYRESGDTSKALSHLMALRRLTDVETRLAASTNTALMAARFDYANQELRIARLKADELRTSIALERAEANFQRTVSIGVLGGAAIVLLLMAIGLLSIRRSRNQVQAANVRLESSNAALEKALAAKTEFLATVSHEVRTPLNGILGMAQVLLSDRTLKGAHHDRVVVVHNAGMAMRALVDDILDVAKMENGNLDVSPEPTDLRAVLINVASLWRDQAVAKGLAFEVDVENAPRWILIDSDRVRQIALNLLSNALKFTATGSIRLAADGDTDGRDLRISISDTGIGIPKHKHAEIFESFRQADSTTSRQFGGTGLGLTICRNIASAMNGTISVDSMPGVGSTFTVTLPLIPADAPACEPDGDDGALILVERNPIARSMLRTLLNGRGGDVCEFDNVDQALAALPRATRLVIDAGTLGDSDDARLDALRDVAAAAETSGTAIFLLWKEPAPSIVGRIEKDANIVLVAKPIAAQTLVELVFDPSNDGLSLVTKAA